MQIFSRFFCLAAFLIFPVSALLLCEHCVAVEGTSKAIEEIKIHNILYEFSLKNTTSRVSHGGELLSYLPFRENSFQQVVEIETPYPYTLDEDHFGNLILKFSLPDIGPYANLKIQVKALVGYRAQPKKNRLERSEKWLQSQQYIEVETPQLERLAKKLQSSDERQMVRNIFNWVADNIEYVGYIKNTRGALYALQKKKGDCTEFAYLFVALCRVSGIPARPIGGYVCPGNCVLKAKQYHNWAEFYHDGAWRIADPQRGLFMEQESDYLAMKVLGPLDENSKNPFHRFKVIGEGLEAQVN